MNRFTAIVLLSVIVLASGCTPPLDKILAEAGYERFPIYGDGHCIGDVYMKDDVKQNANPPMRLILKTPEERAVWMEKFISNGNLPNVTEKGTLGTTVSVDINNVAQLDLSVEGARSFKVTAQNVKEYKPSSIELVRDPLPKILPELPQKKLDKRYMIVGLLQTTDLEYEFYNETGGKVDVMPEGKILEIVKAKFGASASHTTNKTLSIKKPTFIGYRIREIADIRAEGATK